MNSILLGIDALVKGYRLGQQFIEVLCGLSLHVAQGEMVAIMGPSGSGKTTLLNCICGIDTPQSGTVTVAGHVVDYSDEYARTLARPESFQSFWKLRRSLITHHQQQSNFMACYFSDGFDGCITKQPPV